MRCQDKGHSSMKYIDGRNRGVTVLSSRQIKILRFAECFVLDGHELMLMRVQMGLSHRGD